MELQDLRTTLNEMDRELVSLLNKRFEISRQVGEAKKISGKPILDLKREEEILERNREWLAGSPNTEAVELIFRAIFEVSRDIQEEIVHD